MALAVLSIALQTRTFDRSIIPMDEGQLVVIATRILDGDVLYRDVHTGIAPGIYHATAALFALFGRELLVTRWAQVAVNTAIVLVLFFLGRRIMRLRWAVLPPVAYLALTVVGFPVLTMLNYSSVGLALTLGSLLALQLQLASGRQRDGILLGILLACTALTKQNYGALAIAASAIALVWLRPRSPGAERSLVGVLGPVVVSGGTIALLLVIVFALRGALPDLVDSTLLSLGSAQLASFDNPIPPILSRLPLDDPRFGFLYTPPTLFNHMLQGGTILGHPITPGIRDLSIRLSYGLPLAAIVFSPVFLALTDRGRAPRARDEGRAVALFAALFFLGIFPSAIWSHLAFVAPPALLLLALELDRLEDATTLRWPRLRPVAISAALALLVLCGASAVAVGNTIRGWFPTDLDLPRAGLRVSPDAAARLRDARRFVERCAGPDEPIFVAPDIPIVYFLTGRRNPTPYDLAIPGRVDGERIVEILERTQVRCIVLNPRMYPEFPPLGQTFPGLARHLRETYRRAATLGGGDSAWLGLVRRPTLEPRPGARSRPSAE